MKCVVIGLGEFGSAAALLLSRAGAEVIALDSNMDIVERLKDDVAHAVALDARDERALASQGIADADVLIAAIGSDFEAQVLAVVHARALGVRRIVARASTKDHRQVLAAVGANEVLNPEEEAARIVVQRVLVPSIERYFELADGFSLTEVRVPTRLVGQTLRDLDLRRRHRLNLVALVRTEGERRHFDPVPDPERALTAGDTMVLVGADLDVAQWAAAAERG